MRRGRARRGRTAAAGRQRPSRTGHRPNANLSLHNVIANVLGLGTGVFVNRACTKSGWWRHEGRGGGWEDNLERRQDRILDSMVRKLELSDAQRAGIEPILSETWDDTSTLGLGFIERWAWRNST